MRNMSFMLTGDQIRARTKTVTRRLGWLALQRGDLIAACRKCMGLKKGERVERLAVLKVISVAREPLIDIDRYDPGECAAEGFPQMSPAEFVDFFCASHRGCKPSTVITRIEFAYLD
jgi:hypothetical protein